MTFMEHITHELIPPVYDEHSQILILGSMPSKKSREEGFYYMHPKNRFWSIMQELFQEEIIDKKLFLLKHHIALWDTIYSCDIKGSSDSSIQNVVPNNIASLISKTQIKKIFTVGKTSFKYYQKYIYPTLKMESILLPSTSPANCRISMDIMLKDWKIILSYLGELDG